MLFGYYTVYSSLFLALGKAKEGLLLGICRQGLCFIPVILIAPMLIGLSGILYVQPIADVLAAIITIFMSISLNKSLNKEQLYFADPLIILFHGHTFSHMTHTTHFAVLESILEDKCNCLPTALILFSTTQDIF